MIVVLVLVVGLNGELCLMNYYRAPLAANILATSVLILPISGYGFTWFYCMGIWGIPGGSIIGIPLGLVIAAVIGVFLISGANRIEFGYWAFWR